MKPEDQSEFIKTARERFEEGISAESDNRRNHVHDVKFGNGSDNGDQWTEEDKRHRANRPCLTDNRVAAANRQIIGDALLNRPSIKIRPADSVADPIIAEILTGLIRNIEYNSDAETVYDTGHGNAVRGNIGYWRVNTGYSDDDPWDQDIFLERIPNPQSVVLDQGAIKNTYEDGGYGFVAEEMRKSTFEERFPKATTTGWDQESQGNDESGWFAKETVRVAEYWYKENYTKHLFLLPDGQTIELKKPKLFDLPDEGQQPVKWVKDGDDGEPMQYKRYRKKTCKKVMFALITGAEVLEGPKEWPGKYIPIIPCLGEELWIDGKRVLNSAIRYAIEPQRIHNWNVSNDMETKALGPKQPWLVTPEQIEGFEDQWDQAYEKPMPYLQYNNVPGQNPPQRLTGSLPDQGATQGIMFSIDAIKATTQVYDPALGNRSNETSGIAIEKRQRQTSTATYVFVDNQSKAIKYTGRVLVDLIPKIYDSDRIIRILGDDLKKKFQKPMQPGQQPQVDQNGRPLVNVMQDGITALARINFKHPVTGKIYNDLSVGKYDVVVDQGPGYQTRRQEAADGMIQLGSAAPQFMPILVPRIAKNLDWPDADEIGDEIKQATQPPPNPPPDPRLQLEMAKGQQSLQKGELDNQGKKLDLLKKAQDIKHNELRGDERTAAIAQQAVLGILKQIGLIK